MGRIFSGIQPSGDIHLGNYLGALRNWVKLQDEYDDCLYCIVDLHALTELQDPHELPRRVAEAIATNLAVGIDPERSTFFVQSDVPEHTELSWLLTCLTPLGALERMTQYKDKAGRQGQSVGAGLLTYPVLMAADILIYKADRVPVGEDQAQHLELTREIARKFNSTFGETFPEPQILLTAGARIMALNAPEKKMSKSVPGSYIGLSDPPETIRQKVMRAVTDVGPRGAEMSPGVKNLFTILECVAPESVVRPLKEAYGEGTLRYADLKQTLADELIKTLTPIRERRAELLAHPEKLREIAAAGAAKARPLARAVLAEVREKMGIGRIG
ncbi:MAG TPA: tryptophan--tRNA ligase [Firmicutes bacterium]|nr:tryptophan--tRNA ligase [Bacillota bacterium]